LIIQGIKLYVYKIVVTHAQACTFILNSAALEHVNSIADLSRNCPAPSLWHELGESVVGKRKVGLLKQALDYSVSCLSVISEFFFLSISVSSQCAGSEVKPLTEDRGCDSVLLGQSDRTPHGAVIDEYGAMVE
jgi:hypothetical protein